MSGRTAEASTPEIRFKPAPDVYVKAAKLAERLGLSVTDVARIGLAQFADSQQISLAREPQQTLRDLPIHGTTAGRIAEIASAAALHAVQAHVQAGRLAPDPDPGQVPER